MNYEWLAKGKDELIFFFHKQGFCRFAASNIELRFLWDLELGTSIEMWNAFSSFLENKYVVATHQRKIV
jgi:hypothetical protein